MPAASPRALARIEALAWVLIYGGSFTSVIGWVARRQDSGLGLLLVLAGALAAIAGVALIGVRAWLSERAAKHPDPSNHPN